MFASPTLSSSLCLLFWSALALFVLLEPCLSTTEQEQFPAAVLDEAIMAQPEAAAKLCQQFPGLDACQSQMMEKRKSAYMRFGKRSPSLAMPLDIAEAEEQPTMEKRKSAYMRFGKRSSSPAFLTEMEPTMEKRKSAYMRFGKRKSAYMRFGRK